MLAHVVLGSAPRYGVFGEGVTVAVCRSVG